MRGSVVCSPAHSPCCCRRDLKSPNILVDKKWTAKASCVSITFAMCAWQQLRPHPAFAACLLADLRPEPGQAVGRLYELEQPGGAEPPLAGAFLTPHALPLLPSLPWLPPTTRPTPLPLQAPEVMSGEKAGPAADVYSFGVVLWELCTLELPWSRTGPYQVLGALHVDWPAAGRLSISGPDSHSISACRL